MAAEFGDPVIVGAETCLLETCVIQTEQRHAERSVENLGFDSIDLLVLNPFHRVPTAWPATLVAFFPSLGEIFRLIARGKAPSDRKGPNTFDGKEGALLPLVALDHTRSTVLIFVVQALLPQIGWLHHVRVSGNNTHCLSSLYWVMSRSTAPSSASINVILRPRHFVKQPQVGGGDARWCAPRVKKKTTASPQ